MSPSGDEKFRCQRSTIAVGSPWGGTNEVLLNLAALWPVQMKYSRSPVGNGNRCSCSAEVRLLTLKCCWGQIESKWRLEATSKAQVESSLNRHVESNLHLEVSWRGQVESQRPPRGSNLGPRGGQGTQVEPKRLQEAPKRRPRGSKLAPRGAQEQPSTPKRRPRGAQKAL